MSRKSFDTPRTLRRTAIIVALVAAVPLVPWVGLRLRAQVVAARAERALRAAGVVPLHEWPSREANASALRLEQLLEPLDITLIDGSSSPLPDDVRQHVASRLSGWTAPPPQAVVAWHAGRASHLDAVVAHLLGDGLPRWEERPALNRAAPHPDIGGFNVLRQALILHALLAPDTASADAALHAAWRLTEALAERRELMPSLIVAKAFERCAAAVRAARVPAEPWLGRIASLDLREHAQHCADAEIARTLACADDPMACMDTSRHAGPGQSYLTATDPLVRVAFADAAREGAAARAALASASACEEPAPIAAAASGEAGLVRRNVLRFIESLHVQSWERARRAEVRLELTRRALLVRRMHERGEAVTAASLAATFGPAQHGCADVGWRETILDDGAVRIEPTSLPAWLMNAREPDDTRWTVSPPPAPADAP